MNCEICGQAPATVAIKYNGMASHINACGKKAHQANYQSRQRLKAFKQKYKAAEKAKAQGVTK